MIDVPVLMGFEKLMILHPERVVEPVCASSPIMFRFPIWTDAGFGSVFAVVIGLQLYTHFDRPHYLALCGAGPRRHHFSSPPLGVNVIGFIS